MSLTQTVSLWAGLLTSSPGGTMTPNFHFSSVQSLSTAKYYEVGGPQIKYSHLLLVSVCNFFLPGKIHIFSKIS